MCIRDRFSFAGWVRFDSLPHQFERVFDFGSLENPLMRLHHNTGTTLRFATGEWDLVDIEEFWEVGEYVFLVATIDSSGEKTVYSNNEQIAQQPGPALSSLSWQSSTTYRIGSSNWVNEDDQIAQMTTHDLLFYDEVISAACREELMAEVP